MFVPSKIRQKNNKQNNKSVPKNKLHKQMNQITSLKTVPYLDTKDQG